MSRLPRSLCQLVICLTLSAVLLPSLMQWLPAAPGQAMGMLLGIGKPCEMDSRLNAPGSNPASGSALHHPAQSHCLLCFIHAMGIGLPPGTGQWQLCDCAGADLVQAACERHIRCVWLIPEARGPPAFS